MDCRDFEAIIVEIARDRMMDAASRERGLEHVQKCQSCATLLVEERALSRDLRALSAKSAAEEIPARIETALVAAFRQRVAAPMVAPDAAPSPRRRLLAAAVALLTFGLALAGWIASSSRRESPAPDSIHNGIASTPVVAPATERSESPPAPVVAKRQPDRPVPGSAPEKRRKRSAKALASHRSANDIAPREFVTQFFPVMQGSELIPLESGQIVRVRMPRSNLIPLGIPFDQERANETIKADVLLSNDGLARAIRLVY